MKRRVRHMTATEVRALLWHLRRSSPTDKPVVIQRVSLPRIDGDSFRGKLRTEKRRYVIVLNSRIDCVGCEEDTIVHEYAHAVVASRKGRAESHHGPRWGRAYARGFREIEVE